MQPGFVDNTALMGKHTENDQCIKQFYEKSGAMVWILSWTGKLWCICHIEDKDDARAVLAKEGLTVQFSWGNYFIGRFIRPELAMQE